MCVCVTEAEKFLSPRTDVGGDRMRRVTVLAGVAIVLVSRLEKQANECLFISFDKCIVRNVWSCHFFLGGHALCTWMVANACGVYGS